MFDNGINKHLARVASRESLVSMTSSVSSSEPAEQPLVGSPSTLLHSLIRDLSFWDAMPPPLSSSERVTTDATKRDAFPLLASTRSLESQSHWLKRQQQQHQQQQQLYQQQGRRSSRDSRASTASLDYSTASSDHQQNRNRSTSSSKGTIDGRRKPDGSSAELVWKPAVDPITGRTYYYDAISRKTQWEKPPEIRQMEKRRKSQRRKRDQKFFREMEANIMRSLARGERVPGVPTHQLEPTGPPLEPSNTIIAPKSVRTLSRMDDTILAELRDDVANSSADERPITQSRLTMPRTANARGRPPLPTAGLQSSRSSSRTRPVRDTLDSIEEKQQQQPKLQSRSRSPLDNISSRTQTSAGEDPAGGDALAGEHLLDGPIQAEVLTLTNNQLSSNSLSSMGHIRRNTGGTIYMNSTMANPDVEATIKCVCGVYRAHMVQAAERRSKHSPVSVMGGGLDFEIFKDYYHHPMAKHRQSNGPLPSVADIVEFYHEFYRRSQMEHDTIIMSLIYVERLIKTTSVSPAPDNWRSVLFSCMVLASKVWDDLSMWNIDFSNVASAHSQGLSLFTLQRINQLELVLLKSLNFDVKVTASEYAKYYFLIRTMLLRSGLLEGEAKPLGKEDAKLLENRTSQYQDSQFGGERADRRTKSLDDWSWFTQTTQEPGNSSEQAPPMFGPVLKDQVCLEQLVNMSERS